MALLVNAHKFEYCDVLIGVKYFYNVNIPNSLSLSIGNIYKDKNGNCCTYQGIEEVDPSLVDDQIIIIGQYNDCDCKKELVYLFEDCKNGILLIFREVNWNNVIYAEEESVYFNLEKVGCGKYNGRYYIDIDDPNYSFSEIVDVIDSYKECPCKSETRYVDAYKFYICPSGKYIYFTYVDGITQLQEDKNYIVNSSSEKYCMTYQGREVTIEGTCSGTCYVSEGPFDDCTCTTSDEYITIQTCDGGLSFYATVENWNKLKEGNTYSFGNSSYIEHNNQYYVNCFTYTGHTSTIPGGMDEITLESNIGQCNISDCEVLLLLEFIKCETGDSVYYNISNYVLNSMSLNGVHTIKYDNVCMSPNYNNIKEGNIEYPNFDNEKVTAIYKTCDDCIGKKPFVKPVGDTVKYDEINCDFADSVYNKAMSEKNGVQFCCEYEMINNIREKLLMDAGQKQDNIDLCNINNELQ